MVVTCQILLINNTNGVYRAGQLVQGTVKYVIHQRTEFTSITLSLRGKGLCAWVPLLGGIGTIYTGSEDYVDQRIDLLQARENETALVQAGTYEKQFCFALPEVIPSTYKDFRCFISYFVVLKFAQPKKALSFTKRFGLDIRVKGGIKPSVAIPMTYETKKDFFASKNVTLYAEIEKTFFYAGENIKVILNTNNQSEMSIIATSTELIEYITYKSCCKHEKQKSKTVNGVQMKLIGAARSKTEIQKTHSITTTPEMFSIHSNIFTKEYRVKVAIKFPFPYRELSLEIPVVIAEKMNDFEEGKLDDQPPSYWQAMNETKEMEE